MINELIKRYPRLETQKENILRAINLIEETYQSGGKILLCGNGGSCADSEHIVGELMKGFRNKRKLYDAEIEKFKYVTDDYVDFGSKLQKAIPAISLSSQTAIISAFANDVSADMVYAQMVYGYGLDKDLIIALSTSGNSLNVVNAVKVAKMLGMKSISMTGSDRSQLYNMCDCTICAPETETYKIQEYHLPIYHCICATVENDIFGGKEK